MASTKRVKRVFVFILFSALLVPPFSSAWKLDDTPILLQLLQNLSRVDVIVYLEPAVDLPYSDYQSPDDRKAILDEKIRKGLALQGGILSEFQPGEFTLRRKSITGRWFSGSTNMSGISRLANVSAVKAVYPNRRLSPLIDVAGSLIGADYARNLNITGQSQRICLIDSGVDYSHPSLGGCRKIGDGCRIVGGYDLLLNDSDPDDTAGHGTEVAGIVTSTDSQHLGMATGAGIVAIKVFNETISPALDDIAYAIEMCYVEYDAKIISMSLGDYRHYTTETCPKEITETVNDAVGYGEFIVASSGNQGYLGGISYPSCEPNVTSVGAVYTSNWGVVHSLAGNCTDNDTAADKMTCFTNRGQELDILAPGSEVITTQAGGNFIKVRGTSVAAPFVAAAAAVLGQANPSLTSDQITYILLKSGKQIYDKETRHVFPRLDLTRAVKMANQASFITVLNNHSISMKVTSIETSAYFISGIHPTSFLLAPNHSKTFMVVFDRDDTIRGGTYSAYLTLHTENPSQEEKITVTYRKSS
ncbi:MAG: S8 family serine peptidase [Candidatus Altiarchaeota archaeon]